MAIAHYRRSGQGTASQRMAKAGFRRRCGDHCCWATKNQQTYQTFYDGFGGWRWGGFGGTTATTSVENTRVGTVIIDMYDAQNKQLIWRGTAQDTLSEKPEKNENKLDKATEKMFKHF